MASLCDGSVKPQKPSQWALDCLTHGSSFLEVVSSVWSIVECTWPPVPVRTTGNKSPLCPAVISSPLEAWNLISAFISAASLGLLLQVIKFTCVPPHLPLCQCDPDVGLSDLWETRTGVAAYWGRSFTLFIYVNLYMVMLPEKGAHFSGKPKDYQDWVLYL